MLGHALPAQDRNAVEFLEAFYTQFVPIFLFSVMVAMGLSLTVGDLPTVPGDRVQLRQLLQSLLQNALRYRQPDEAPDITITSTSTDDEWVVSVGDDGIGIDESEHQRIFELFRRGQHEDGQDGVGLGLALAQRVAERHDGRIWVESAPGQGATFHVALPKHAD